MKVIIGSKNPAKIQAVRNALMCYKNLDVAQIESLSVVSGVSAQPMSLEETVQGAINRSKAAFRDDCTYSIGLESGLMEVPFTKTGSMDVCACSIFDGKEVHLGLSSAFELPKLVNTFVKERGMEINEAVYKADLSEKKEIGSDIGLIGLVTNGLITRKDQAKQAIYMALVHITRPDLY